MKSGNMAIITCSFAQPRKNKFKGFAQSKQVPPNALQVMVFNQDTYHVSLILLSRSPAGISSLLSPVLVLS
jgi:hypothetical protein